MKYNEFEKGSYKWKHATKNGTKEVPPFAIYIERTPFGTYKKEVPIERIGDTWRYEYIRTEDIIKSENKI